MNEKNPYSCPICNTTSTLFYQYPMICAKCWSIIGKFETMQLQMRLIFWSALKNNKSLSMEQS